jgi:uncharacterized protein YecT (DUF1311 family)
MYLIRAIVTLALIPSSALMAQTQHSLDDRSNQRARRADSTLNVLYRQVEAKYRSDSVALRKVRAAEHAWLAFRDAQIAVRMRSRTMQNIEH